MVVETLTKLLEVHISNKLYSIRYLIYSRENSCGLGHVSTLSTSESKTHTSLHL